MFDFRYPADDPLIWSFERVKRVLDTSVPMRYQVLLLPYPEAGWVDTVTLRQWVEYSNLSVCRKTVLAKLHKKRLIEHDAEGGRARISPKGIMVVERNA